MLSQEERDWAEASGMSTLKTQDKASAHSEATRSILMCGQPVIVAAK